MPRRTNLFQEVVATVQSHMAAPVEVVESAELEDALTGEAAEVDAVIQTTAAGHPIAVSVEATSTKRPATVEWVQRMLRKHKHLPTDKLILVSEAGFTKTARALADAEHVVALAPEDLSEDDPAGVIVNKLRSIWPKHIELVATGAQVLVPSLNTEWTDIGPGVYLYLQDQTMLGQLSDALKGWITSNWRKIEDDIGMRDIAEDLDAPFTLGVGPPVVVIVDGRPSNIYVRQEKDKTALFHRVDGVRFRGEAKIRVTEVSLEHKRLGDVMYAFGKGMVGERAAVVVATEGEGGGKATLRFSDKPTN